MLRKGNKEITGIYIGRRMITAVYVGAKQVWSVISSCFGIGYWKGDEPWNGADAWNGSNNLTNDKQSKEKTLWLKEK